MDIKNQYEVIGKDYIKGQKEYFSKREGEARTFLRKFLVNLKHKKILDIGCGHGEDIVMCEKLGAKEIYGIDVSKVMIEGAKTRVREPQNLIVGNIEKMKFKSNFFDIVVSRFSLNYLTNLDRAFSEISRVLNKGGELIVITHHPFRDVTLQKKKVYGKKEIVNLDLYKNKVKIHFPTHTFSNYFSEIFLRNFDLKEIIEEKAPEEYVGKEKIITPGFLGFMAVKR